MVGLIASNPPLQASRLRFLRGASGRFAFGRMGKPDAKLRARQINLLDDEAVRQVGFLVSGEHD